MEITISMAWTLQITNWIHRTQGKYRKLQFSKTIEGMLNINNMKNSFSLLKSLEIAAINNETELLHPNTHEFWEELGIRTEFL